jgi:hypothetical protein
MVKIQNKESAKHAAQTLRIFGVAQFAHYGVQNLNNLQSDNTAIFYIVMSAGVFIAMEYAGINLLNKG